MWYKPTMKTLQLKKDSERRFKSGHPWVFSNELQSVSKNIPTGEIVELHDAGGQFLARGYFNPHSLIAFRALSRDSSVSNLWSESWLEQQLFGYSLGLREGLGLGDTSARICFGEADRIPGLIVDRYFLTQGRGQVWVIQAHTAGVNAAIPQIVSFLKKRLLGKKIAIVLRNDVGVRKLEGLSVDEPQVVQNDLKDVDLSQAEFDVRGMVFRADLVRGQKTGFFLDQSSHAVRMGKMIQSVFVKKQEVKILDLFCYVGQWGTILSQSLRSTGVREIHVTAMDASEDALRFAEKNLSQIGVQVETVKADILEKISQIPDQRFDIVICDPPALIKSKKDFAPGKQAYVKLNTESLRALKKPGIFISSSCSAHLTELDFNEVLMKAGQRSKAQVRWIDRSGHGWDHPVVAEFPEGRYLKTWLGWASGDASR